DIGHGEGGAAAAARWGVMALDASAAGEASSAGRDGAVDALTAMLQRRRHEPRVMSATAVIETPIEPLVFDLWLETILTLCGPELLRFKAIIHIAGEEAPLALHAVQHVLHPPVALPRWPSDDRRSRFVLIGKNIPRRLLDESIAFLRNPPELAASDPFSEPEDASRGATAPAPA
ncbi:GTP-binding protein, partial [Rubrimonas sp.]|uniref:GTP-binding protein n=1 Tax=Rubrimonas sp. TaxID=2036015 RepID=UPI002FDF01C7